MSKQKNKENQSIVALDELFDGLVDTVEPVPEVLIFGEDLDHIEAFGDSFDSFEEELDSIILGEGFRSEFAVFGDGEFAEFLDSFFEFAYLELVLVGVLGIGELLLLELVDELIFLDEFVFEDVDLFFEGLDLFFVGVEFELVFVGVVAGFIKVFFEHFLLSIDLDFLLFDVEYFFVQELDALFLETHFLILDFELLHKSGNYLLFLLQFLLIEVQFLILKVQLIYKLVDMFSPELDLGLEGLCLVDLGVGEVLEGLVGRTVVRVEGLVGQTLLQFLYFVLVLLDFVLFLDQELLKSL